MRLEFQATAPCWVSAVVDGRKAVARIMRPGEHEMVMIEKEAVVDVGDAAAFTYTIDGRPGRSLGTSGQVRTLKLTRDTRAQYVR
jgi:hypothetical protein